VWKVGNRTLLLELTLTLSEWKRPLPVVIPFPPTPYSHLSGGSSAAAPKQIAADVVARERWRAETSVRQKHAAMVAWMKRDRGATARELVELSGWRKTTVVAFVQSLSRKGREVAWERNAAGEPLPGAAFSSGDTLSLKVYVRNACTGSGKNSGRARLWFNDSAANSRFNATVGSSSTYYLLGGFQYL